MKDEIKPQKANARTPVRETGLAKFAPLLISTLIISGSESETWLQCSDGAGAFVPKARLRGSQYGKTKIFDADAKTAVLVSLSGPVGPTYYLIDSSDADPCFRITILGTGKDGETANSGLAHAWVATETGAPGWCISAKAGKWIPMKAEGGACPPA